MACQLQNSLASLAEDKVDSTFDGWRAVTTDEVSKLIGSALCKTCQLDPAPTWLVKEVCALLSPFLATLFNKSLATGCFPSELPNIWVGLSCTEDRAIGKTLNCF